MKKFLIFGILQPVAIILITVIGFLSYIYSIIDVFFSVRRKRFFEVGGFFEVTATSIDICGGTICQRFFNSTLITKESKHRFGVNVETVSYTLGKNQRDNTLTKLGRRVAKVLDTVERDHCKKAVIKNEK